MSPAAAAVASTSSRAPPSTAVIPVGVTAAAAAIALPRSRTKTMACSALITPVPAAAVISPTLCPAPTPTVPTATAGCGNTSSSATSPAATMSGCATAVSLMVSASLVVPCATRSMPATVPSQLSRSATPGSSSQGPRKPGVWEPWPGATTASTALAFRPVRTGVVLRRVVRRAAVGRSPRVAPGGPAAGAPVRIEEAAAYGRGMDVRRAEDRYLTSVDWLRSRHSFSSGPHYDPANTGFGLLLVNNDDRARRAPGSTRTPTGTWRS